MATSSPLSIATAAIALVSAILTLLLGKPKPPSFLDAPLPPHYLGEGWEKSQPSSEALTGEARQFEAFAQQIQWVQNRNRRGGKADRAVHAKMHLGVTNASLEINPDLPEFLHHGIFQPGREYRAAVRLSNAGGTVKPDAQKDLRGLAVRVYSTDTEGTPQFNDLLLTNAPASHARNAQQFMASLLLFSGRPGGFLKLGLGEMVRILLTLRRDRTSIPSVASETYWSRGPFQLGKAALQFFATPTPETRPNTPDKSNPNYLRADLEDRLHQGNLVFDFYAQLYVNDRDTPIEDGAKLWETSIAPPIPLAQLVIPAQDLNSSTALDAATEVQQMSFNPWNGAGAQNFKPLGSLNRARQPVYQASAGLRTEQPPAPQTSRCPFAGIARLLLKPVGALVKLLEAALLFSNRLQFPWDRWAQISPWLGVLNLVGLRTQLRQHNLCDTETPASLAEYENLPQSCPVMSLVHRTADGSRNDLSHPHMGRALTRFGRNIPLESVKRPTAADLLTPNPRTVARELMTRTTFQPVAQLNLLAAAWIQFMVHDWLFHEVDPTQSVEIPIEDPDWPSDQQPMRVLRTAVDPLAAQDPPGHPTSFVNRETHWWDGSQLYGSTPELQQRVRTHQGGKLWIQERGLLPIYENPGGWTDHNVMAVEETGVRDNWWLGLGLLHSLFTLEHNAIAEHLHAAYPSWDDEHLFQTARLINTALLAKIHTVEWTPAILDNPALEIGMNGNWWGIAGERIHKLLGRLSDSEVLSGIPGSTKDHFGVTYAMTEEFTSVYRLHPLLPDELVFHTLLGGRIDTLQMPWMTEPQSVASLGDVVGPKARAFMESPQWEMADLFYSFGLMHPGAIALHNYPNFLRQSLTHVDAAGAEHLIDLAAVEIFRDRERGVPRYNEFRQLLHKPPVRSFEELTGGNRAEADRIRAVYHNRLDDVDLLVGLMAEQPLPQGFGFSDTAFRIFILMASRRLNSDRFFTTDYTPEVYTPEGLQWIANNTLTSVLLRQFPQLAPALRQSKNAFAPWQRVS